MFFGASTLTFRADAEIYVPSLVRTVPSAPEFHRIMVRSTSDLVGCTTDWESSDVYRTHPAPKELMNCVGMVPLVSAGVNELSGEFEGGEDLVKIRFGAISFYRSPMYLINPLVF